MRLSERLTAVKNYVPRGHIVADIGADRGELSFQLLHEGIVPGVILSDISAKSIKRAESLFSDKNEAEFAEFRVGSGLSVLKPGEVETAVFAGMGGFTIRDILIADTDVVRSLKTMVIQAMGNTHVVRKTVLSLGFIVKSEVMLLEEGQYYTVLLCIPGEQTLDDTELFAGPCLIREKSTVLLNYLREEYAKENALLKYLETRGEGEKRREELRKKILLIEDSVKRMGVEL